ncbi:hypothetical protein AB1Y20_004077 [Prymnesium parvum]|uniref:Phosphoglycerate mutase (2,3-diphosphoglycerate-dependent) n=1 Tax=Prymnesium parvum TaxID=97485 RepID=A0AB34J738_PRYPA
MPPSAAQLDALREASQLSLMSQANFAQSAAQSMLPRSRSMDWVDPEGSSTGGGMQMQFHSSTRAAVDPLAPPEGVELDSRGMCVHLVGVNLNSAANEEAKGKEGKHGKSMGVYVVMYVVDHRGEPVGSAAKWESRARLMPLWNSALPVGASVAPPTSVGCRLAVELWELYESSSVLAAGPAFLKLEEMSAREGLHLPTTVVLSKPDWQYKKGSWSYHGPEASSSHSPAGEEGTPVTLYVLKWPSRRKRLFFVRHGESKWNAAKREKNLYNLVREHDHPLTDVGYRQALLLQQFVQHHLHLPEEQLSETVCALVRCDTLWASPLTRALQTALVGLQPLLEAQGATLELKQNARERKNWGGFDSIGRVYGAACKTRALAELRALGDGAPPESVMRSLQTIRVDHQEVSEPWWSDTPESDEQMSVRIATFVNQIKYAPSDTIVVVGHSHFYRSFFHRLLHPVFRRKEPELSDRLQTTSMANGTLLCLELDFDHEPFACVGVAEIGLAKEEGKPPLDDAAAEGSASRSAAGQSWMRGWTSKVTSKIKAEQGAKAVNPQMIKAMQEARDARGRGASM